MHQCMKARGSSLVGKTASVVERWTMLMEHKHVELRFGTTVCLTTVIQVIPIG
jgi:hypothetical protein